MHYPFLVLKQMEHKQSKYYLWILKTKYYRIKQNVDICGIKSDLHSKKATFGGILKNVQIGFLVYTLGLKSHSSLEMPIVVQLHRN